MKLRIKFRKYGPIRFIGHLDVMRFFQKANRRAELDVAYTGGFSPHQIVSFAAPLGVGLTNNGEYMDLEVHSLTSCEGCKAAVECRFRTRNRDHFGENSAGQGRQCHEPALLPPDIR